MTDEEKAEYSDAILEIKNQIAEAQQYWLEIKAESKVQIKQILPGVRSNGVPSEEAVKDIINVIMEEL